MAHKTAWYLCHRIRQAMAEANQPALGGTIEVDETYIGGAARFMHADKRGKVKAKGSSWMGKVAVMGLLERHG